jgi:hypothetical protein
VDRVCENPSIGEQRKGDLAGISVHKFKFNRQEYLIAYRPPVGNLIGDASQSEFLMIDFYLCVRPMVV